MKITICEMQKMRAVRKEKHIKMKIQKRKDVKRDPFFVKNPFLYEN